MHFVPLTIVYVGEGVGDKLKNVICLPFEDTRERSYHLAAQECLL